MRRHVGIGGLGFREDVLQALLVFMSTRQPVDPQSLAPVQGHLIRWQLLAIVNIVNLRTQDLRPVRVNAGQCMVSSVAWYL